MYISQPPQPKAHTQTHKQILMARLYTRLTTTHAQPCAHIDTHVHALSFFLFFFFKSPPLYLCQMHPQNTLSHLGGKAAEGASLRYDSAHGQRITSLQKNVLLVKFAGRCMQTLWSPARCFPSCRVCHAQIKVNLWLKRLHCSLWMKEGCQGAKEASQ